jgi:hypothetical protein
VQRVEVRRFLRHTDFGFHPELREGCSLKQGIIRNYVTVSAFKETSGAFGFTEERIVDKPIEDPQIGANLVSDRGVSSDSCL